MKMKTIKDTEGNEWSLKHFVSAKPLNEDNTIYMVTTDIINSVVTSNIWDGKRSEYYYKTFEASLESLENAFSED